MNKFTCFKKYDVRGKLGTEINEEIAWRIGRAYGEFIKPKSVVIGGDVRLSSHSLKNALGRGLQDSGVNVLDIGVVGTEEIYFSTFYLGVDGGIEVTASHNPMDYNGMKFVRAGATPISGDSGLYEIRRLAEEMTLSKVDESKRGTYKLISTREAYIEHILRYIDLNNLKPLKIVINSGNGAAGPVIDSIERKFEHMGVPVTFVKVHNEPNGNFPNGIPNPLLLECREDTIRAVIDNNADLGIAFDGDFDRCFFFDSHGTFIEGYYIVGLLAAAFLEKNPGAKIIHDPRLIWNTIDIISESCGIPIQSKTGHAFIKERMRNEDAIYGGEMSAHHYFRDFAYCDSGMIPWLLIIELLSIKNKTLYDLVAERIAFFPSSGEINISINDSGTVIKKIQSLFDKDALSIDMTDGLSMEFSDWRFNLRESNTESLIRLNIETRNNVQLLREKIKLFRQIFYRW